MKRRMKKMTSLALASILAVSFPFAGGTEAGAAVYVSEAADFGAGGVK